MLAAGLRYLEARSRSIAETRRRLTDAGYRAELVDAVIDRLTGLGLLDDTAFARSWVESRDRAHPRGERALRRELRLKGVPTTIVDEVLTDRSAGRTGRLDEPSAEPATDPDERAAMALLQRRSAALQRVQDARQRRQRAYSLLVRHGFSPDLAGRVATSAMAAERPDEVLASDDD